MSEPGREEKPIADLCVSDFDFDLPAELIAQHPPAERGTSRMLVMDRATGSLSDAQFSLLPSLLRPGDLLVFNDSRVIPARLYARRATTEERQQSCALIEVLLTEPADEGCWRALVKPGRKVPKGTRLIFPSPAGDIELEAEVLEHGNFGERLLRFAPVADFFAALERIGHMPLPPYIRRDDANADRDRYQTVFARNRGSVAAPTAGLHFTPQVLQAFQTRGIETASITLHVGLGTFAPLRVERVAEVHLHHERYTLGSAAVEKIHRALREGRRVVAAGTTVVRTLEAAAQQAVGEELQPHSGTTNIFLSPGYDFRVVGALLTNFHLPKSSLLMLVSAFAGREHVLAAYRHAVEAKYRFFSYGDCMLIG